MHAKYADGSARLQAMDHAFDYQARLAEIKQLTEPQAGRFEIVGALHPVRVVQCFDGPSLQASPSRGEGEYHPVSIFSRFTRLPCNPPWQDLPRCAYS